MLQKAIDMLEDVKGLLRTSSPASNMIGIGITTHNRPDMLARALEFQNRYLPHGAKLVVVDDASRVPVEGADFRFESCVGIARSKNKCLELLYDAGCEHFFLFDDDTWPAKEDWHVPYVTCPEPHLNYIFVEFASGIRTLNDTKEIYRDKDKIAYTHARGCMLYFERIVLDTVGGMDPVFGKWGYEHPSLSDRIFNAGLTTFRYMDVNGSAGLIYSDDEHNDNRNTTVGVEERQKAIAVNAKLYEARKGSKEYIPFRETKNIILTSVFSKVEDPQRKGPNTINLAAVTRLVESAKGRGMKVVVLHDFDDPDLPETEGPDVDYVKVNTSLNPYFQRWVSYREYLIANRGRIDKVFCVDGTDVEVLKTPAWDLLDKDYIYVGEEPQLLDDTAGWMRKHHLDAKIQNLLDQHGKDYVLLNAGILGGHYDTVMEFIKLIVDYYSDNVKDILYHNKPSLGDGDMGIFNYVARVHFPKNIVHGRMVCTEFKREEYNDHSWFKHK